MTKFISASSYKRFLLLNIRISINFQSLSVARNSDKNKLIWCKVQCLQQQKYIIATNFTAINVLVTQRSWMNWMNPVFLCI